MAKPSEPKLDVEALFRFIVQGAGSVLPAMSDEEIQERFKCSRAEAEQWYAGWLDEISSNLLADDS
jgi:hypothetical protein